MAATTALGSAAPAQRMTRWRWATALFLTLSLADLFLTWFMLESLGGAEANPCAAQVLELFGWPGLALHKFGCVALILCLVGVIVKRRPRLARFVLRTGCLSVLIVVSYSLWLLLAPDGLLCASEELTGLQRERDQLAVLHVEQNRCRDYSTDLVSKLARGEVKLAEAASDLQAFLRTCGYDPMRFLPGYYDELRGEACLAAHLVHGVGFEVASAPEARSRLDGLKREFAHYGVPLPDLALSSFDPDPEAFLKQRRAERAQSNLGPEPHNLPGLSAKAASRRCVSMRQTGRASRFRAAPGCGGAGECVPQTALPISAFRTGGPPHPRDRERYKICH